MLNAFDERYDHHYTTGTSAKLGLTEIVDGALIDDLLALMARHRMDWTGTFRALADELRGNPATLEALVSREHIAAWLERWRNALATQGRNEPETAEAMDTINPTTFRATISSTLRCARRPTAI